MQVEFLETLLQPLLIVQAVPLGERGHVRGFLEVAL